VIALFWDVDGTLLTTARAGVYALEAALRDVTGKDADLQQMVTAGLTDAEVAALALATAGREADDDVVDAFLRAYERHLPECLHRRRGHVMPGVREALEDLDGDPAARSFLLTGNTPAGARAKLAHYGLDRFFSDGAFCLGAGARDEIARRGLPLADGAEVRFVIGATPQAFACGKAIGGRTIAVGSGSYSSGTPSAHEPWRVLNRIPEPPDFRALLGIDGR